MTAKTRQTQSFDVMVLGAGIVGVCTALHLRRLGLDVALIDRKHPGEEASFGNAGIVQRNGFVPHKIPMRPLQLLGIALGQSSAVSLDPATVVRMLPWLRQFHKAGSERGTERYSRVVAPLRAFAVEEHLELARSTNADRFYRQGGCHTGALTGDRAAHHVAGGSMTYPIATSNPAGTNQVTHAFG